MNTPTWNLKTLTCGKELNEEVIQEYKEGLAELVDSFVEKYKGKVKELLPDMLKDMLEIYVYGSDVTDSLWLMRTTDVENKLYIKWSSQIVDCNRMIFAEMEFVTQEISVMTEDEVDVWAKKSDVVKAHVTYLKDVIRDKKHMLSEKEEQILTKFGSQSREWDEAVDVFESELRIKVTENGEEKEVTDPKASSMLKGSNNADDRYSALKGLNSAYKDTKYAWLRTYALNVVANEKNINDNVRGYKHVLDSRNTSNKLSDESVKALHDTVKKKAKDITSRFFKIIRDAEIKHGRTLIDGKLNWSDLYANPFKKEEKQVSWDEAKQIVLDTYDQFSPKMGKYAHKMFNEDRIDANMYEYKQGGAYSASFFDHKMTPQSFILMNFAHNLDGVFTLAHEMGHSIHGFISMEKQTPITCHAPMAYCETASTFGEMLVFEKMIANIDDEELELSILCDKVGDWLCTVVRQIMFSEFEQKFHEARKNGKLSEKEFTNYWMYVCKEYYGDVFNYKDMDYMWSCIPHFMRPFYVYSYAFGELFVQSLFAEKDNIPNFEEKYLEMLASGNTKTAEELVKSFGLDLTDENFWANGIKVSAEKWLDRMEAILNK